MAIQILPILKAIAPLVANATRIAANLKSSKGTASSDEKLRKLEQEAIETAKLLATTAGQLEAVAQQLDAAAEQLRLQEVRLAANEKRARRALAAAVAAALACSALAVYAFLQ